MLIIICCIISINVVHAYWNSVIYVFKQIDVHINTGLYYYGDHIYTYDSSADYRTGDIVVKNGEYFIVNFDLPHTDWWHDPDNINTNIFRKMRYSKATSEYVGYNYYEFGNYVVYNNETYVLNVRYHSPNTITQVSPENSSRWVLVASYPLDTWCRYKIYYAGDIINYNGIRYRCLKDGSNQANPEYSVNDWKRI